MDYSIEDRGHASVIRFGGDLAGDDADALKRMFIDLRRAGTEKVAVDMRRVEFMDSTVIGLFVWGMKNLREDGCDFRLFHMTKPVAQLFEITQLDRAFQIFDAESSALESYA